MKAKRGRNSLVTTDVATANYQTYDDLEDLGKGATRLVLQPLGRVD